MDLESVSNYDEVKDAIRKKVMYPCLCESCFIVTLNVKQRYKTGFSCFVLVFILSKRKSFLSSEILLFLDFVI